VFLCDENQVIATLDTIADFARVSGLTLNVEKTEAMWIGSYRDRKEKLFGFKWSKVIRYLGIYIGYDKEETNKWNWINKLETFQKTLDCWRTRDMTIFGRITIVKTLALAKLIYSATMLPIPEGICKRIENAIDEFLWKGRKRRIKKEVLQKPVSQGGIGQIDIQSNFDSLKASWVPRIINHPNDTWSDIPQLYLNKYGKNMAILNFNFTKPTAFPDITKIPMFYQEVVMAFHKSQKGDKPQTKSEFLNSIIWGNNNFVPVTKHRVGQTLYNKHWLECGILRMGDIVSQEGKLQMEILNTKILLKHDFLSMQSKITDVIRQYRHLFNEIGTTVRICNNIPDPSIIETKDGKKSNICHVRSNFFYQSIRGSNNVIIRALEKWESELECTIDPGAIFDRKVRCMKDKKLSAFSFKLLHKILICGETLSHWRKINSSICSLCKTTHSLKHMLFDCEHACNAWSKINMITNQRLSWKDIVLGIGVKHLDVIVTQIAFLLYKAWILEINNKKIKNFKQYLYSELKSKKLQYAVIGDTDISNSIENVLLHL